MTDASRMPKWIKILLLGRNPRRTLIRVFILAAVTFLTVRYALLPTRVRGVSMEPTFTDGAFHLVNLLAYRQHEPRRGDIVVITMAGRRAFYLKRVIGLPGELIEFVDGRLLINGEPAEEPYVQGSSSWTVPEVALADGEFYVAGDNRRIQWEFHSMGVVERNKIQGRVLGRKASWHFGSTNG